MDSSLHWNLDLFGDKKKPTGILVNVLITYRSVCIYVKIGYSYRCCCEIQEHTPWSVNVGLGAFQEQMLNISPSVPPKPFNFYIPKANHSAVLVFCITIALLRWQRCRKMKVMNCVSSIQTPTFLSTTRTGKSKATLKCNVAQGWQNEKAPAKRSIYSFHSSVMVYKSSWTTGYKITPGTCWLSLGWRCTISASPDELHVNCITLA